MDAIDGKQARRTDNCSCLGQLLDHNLDQFNYSFFVIASCAMCKTKDNLISVSMIVLGQLMPHYSVEYRKHFSSFHATVVDLAGGL